jgi:hypothetical protein
MSELQNIQLNKEQQKQALRTLGRQLLYLLLSLPFLGMIIWKSLPAYHLLTPYLGEFWSSALWLFILSFTITTWIALLIGWDDAIPIPEVKRGPKYWGSLIAVWLVLSGSFYWSYALHRHTEQGELCLMIFRSILAIIPAQQLGTYVASKIRRLWTKSL